VAECGFTVHTRPCAGGATSLGVNIPIDWVVLRASWRYQGGVYLNINGQSQYLWCTVDQEGQVINILVQNRRDSIAAERSRQLRLFIPLPPL
jgi:hypothetical protein